MSRKATPTEDEMLVLTKSRRRCCICFGLNHDLDWKVGQIAHIDRNSSNSSFENLTWMCLEHHDQYDSKTSQSKGLRPREIKFHRNKLYKVIDDIWENEPIRQELSSLNNAKFLIGNRLKYLRDELGVSSSEFIELIGYESEKEYLEMEVNSLECPLSVVRQIHNATRVSESWLKHGNCSQCSVESLRWYENPVDEAEMIANLKPQLVYLTIATTTPRTNLPIFRRVKDLYSNMRDSYLHTGLLVQTQPYLYKTYDLYLSLEFWKVAPQLIVVTCTTEQRVIS